MSTVRCPNLNHRRSNAPVRACPSCGEIVNHKVRAKRCTEREHASRRRNGDVFCVDCENQLRPD